VLLSGLLGITAFSQKNSNNDHTLLWKISGNGLKKPSYLFGTIHMLCEDDAVLSDSLKSVIKNVKEVYFEVDLDNMFELLGVMSKMKMQGDTTLQDLLSESDYEKVKSYFETNGSILPFSMIETYKPMLAASTLQQGGLPCENTAMMEQVILNLVSNAAQASPAGGVVTVKTQRTEGGVWISVIDRGSGIEAKNLESIFNPFFTTKAEGVGLGLAVVSKIVEEHGGEISVDSTPGEGSVFLIRLPMES